MNWFSRNGIFFIPSSAYGWLIFVLGISYSVYSFIEIDSNSHSVSDTLMNFIFRLFIVYSVYAGIALLTSRKKAEN